MQNFARPLGASIGRLSKHPPSKLLHGPVVRLPVVASSAPRRRMTENAVDAHSRWIKRNDSKIIGSFAEPDRISKPVQVRYNHSSGAAQTTSDEGGKPRDGVPTMSTQPRVKAYIGLGSNTGDRVELIQQACREMDQRGIHVTRTSSLWETEAMYVEDQDMFINGIAEVSTELSPLDLLDQLQTIEKDMGRTKSIDKGPRNIDLDIVLYGDQRWKCSRLTIPHKLMLERHFVLRPLCQLIPNANHPDLRPSSTLSSHLESLPPTASPMSTLTPLSPQHPPLTSLVSTRSTRLMAIVNITPDSFSDGGGSPWDHHQSSKSPKALCEWLVDQLPLAGLAKQQTILDIGGQSTRPGAVEVSAETEIDRVVPFIKALRSTSTSCISIDTYRAHVAAEAIRAGANIVNDVSAGTLDPEMLPTVARLGCPIILMHMRGTPATMNDLTSYPSGLIPTIGQELLARVRAAEEAGIRRWQIILDPGIGFAKTAAQNLETLRRFAELRATTGLEGIPWLVGTSRKGFIGKVTGVKEPSQRGWGTAAAVTAAVQGGADIVRVHDVREMQQVVAIADAIWRVDEPK